MSNYEFTSRMQAILGGAAGEAQSLNHEYIGTKHLLLRPPSRKVLELAGDEAPRMNHSFVGTEHLVLGLLAEGKGIASGVLLEFGVSLAGVRTEVLNILGRTRDHEHHARTAVLPHEPPARIAVVLEYGNGAVISKHFRTTREAIAFLQEE